MTLVGPGPLVAQAADRAARVDEILAGYDGSSPGVVVAVVRDGQVVFARGYGMANLEHGVPLTRESVLDIGSVSKQFTAFAVVLLAQEGKLALDDDIRAYLPEVPDFGSVITVRQLIHHTSGLREIYTSEAIAGYRGGDGIRQEDALQLIGHMRELNFEPGTEHLYCNTGYMLLADIVARVSGQPFSDFMAERVFGPLGMDHTTIMSRPGQSIRGAAESYARVGEDGGFVRVFDNSSIQGAGGIYTTVDDLARWMGNFATHQVGGAEAMEQMKQVGVLANGDTLDYAFGITVREMRGQELLSHGGSSAGYRASFDYLPTVDGGVITLSNLAQVDGSIAERVGEVFFGDILDPVDGPEDGAVSGPATQALPDVPVEVDESTLESLVGDYELEARPGFVLSFTREGTELFGRATGQDRNRFTPSSDSTFHLGGIAWVTFHREPDGSVRSLTLHQNGHHPAHRVEEAWEPSAEDLAQVEGRYFSPELETLYTVYVEDGTLMARHRRHGDLALTPIEADVFQAPAILGQVRFQRNPAGAVTGLRVDNGRVRNLFFEKLRE